LGDFVTFSQTLVVWYILTRNLRSGLGEILISLACLVVSSNRDLVWHWLLNAALSLLHEQLLLVVLKLHHVLLTHALDVTWLLDLVMVVVMSQHGSGWQSLRLVLVGEIHALDLVHRLLLGSHALRVEPSVYLVWDADMAVHKVVPWHLLHLALLDGGVGLGV
jgi:hypothetical protein